MKVRYSAPLKTWRDNRLKLKAMIFGNRTTLDPAASDDLRCFVSTLITLLLESDQSMIDHIQHIILAALLSMLNQLFQKKNDYERKNGDICNLYTCPFQPALFFRLLVTTIIQHGRINGHIGSYSSRRGRPKIICRGTATGNERDDASHSETAINYALLFSFHWRVYAQGIAYHCCIQDAKQDDISAHFQSFGELDNINLKTDPATGRSRRGVVFAPVSTA